MDLPLDRWLDTGQRQVYLRSPLPVKDAQQALRADLLDIGAAIRTTIRPVLRPADYLRHAGVYGSVAGGHVNLYALGRRGFSATLRGDLLAAEHGCDLIATINRLGAAHRRMLAASPVFSVLMVVLGVVLLVNGGGRFGAVTLLIGLAWLPIIAFVLAVQRRDGRWIEAWVTERLGARPAVTGPVVDGRPA